MTQSAENDRTQAVILRHRFLATDGADVGFCGGPYCATGVIPVAEHAAHVADMLSVIPPEVTHCANCGGEVPVDEPHKVGECPVPPVVSEGGA